jgi:hypothetical protein
MLDRSDLSGACEVETVSGEAAAINGIAPAKQREEVV